MKKIFRNWEEICRIGRWNPWFMIVASTIDVESLNTVSERIVEAFPECFSRHDIHKFGRIPLSVVKFVSSRRFSQNDPDSVSIAKNGTLDDLSVPYLRYTRHGEENIQAGIIRLPDWLNEQFAAFDTWDRVGRIYDCYGLDFYLLDCSEADGEYIFVGMDAINIEK